MSQLSNSLQELNDRFQKFASDLFALEINTILKDNMTGTPWTGPGDGLLDIASEYRAKLMELEKKLPGGTTPALDEERRKRAETGTTVTRQRFDDLREWAKALCSALRKLDPSPDVQRALGMAQRICDNSDQIKGVFDVLLLTREPPEINRANAKQSNLELRPQDLATIRKIWEIGVEEIVMQTVIHLDGDVILRVQPVYAGSEGRDVLQLHNSTVQVAVNFWSALVGILISGLERIGGK